MVRLPDIPVQSWLADQTQRFHEATGGYFDALEFDDQAKQQEASIPPDYPLPGGPDQWDQAAIQHRTDELQRQQDEEQRQQQEAQQARVQQLEAQQQADAERQQRATQDEAQQRDNSVMSFIRNIGIPTPDQVFGNLSMLKQPDHTSSTGVLDSLPADTRQADSGAHELAPAPTSAPTDQPQSPTDQFSDFVNQTNSPVFGDAAPSAATPEPDHTSSTGLLDSIGQGISNVGSRIQSALTTAPDMGPQNPHPSRALSDLPGDVANVASHAFAGDYGVGAVVQDQQRISELRQEMNAASGQDPNNLRNRVLTNIDPTWAAQNPDKASELQQLQDNFAMTVGGMAGAGGGGGIAQDAIAAIRAMRAANLGDDLVLAAEQKLAQGSSMTLEQVQKLTGSLKPTAPATPAEPAGVENPWKLTPEEEALNAAADQRARTQPAHAGYLEDPTFTGDQTPAAVYGEVLPGIEAQAPPWEIPTENAPVEAGDRVRLTDGTEGEVSSRQQHVINGETNEFLTVHEPDGTVSRVDPTDVESVQRANPAAAPAAAPAAVPTQGSGPVAQIQPSGPLTPEQKAAFDADVTKLEAQHRNVAAGIIGRPADHKDVTRVLNALETLRTQLSDKHAGLAAVQRHVEKLKGAPLAPDEQAWLLARVYQGHGDAAMARMEATVMPAYTQLHPADTTNLEHYMEQLSNINTDAAVRGKEQTRVLEGVQPGKPGINTVRREGEATLEHQRARSNLAATEKEWLSARTERDALLREMNAAGEGPTSTTDFSAQPHLTKEPLPNGTRRRTVTAKDGPFPEQSMETNRSITLQDRLEASDQRFRIAEVKRADARRAVAESAQLSQARNESRTMERAATRAATIGSERRYSGGATPLESAAMVKQGWLERLGPARAQKMFDAADAFYRLRDQMRDRLVSSGVWTKEYADGLKEAFPYYSPTRILKHLDQSVDPAMASSMSFSTRDDGVRHITNAGTVAARMAPTQAMVEMAFKAEELASRNVVMNAVHGWIDQPGMQNFVKAVKGDHVDDGWKAMTARINGTPTKIQVVQPLADAMDLNSPAITGMAGAVLNALRAPLQLGATALRPAFIFRNAINDAVLALYRFSAESKSPMEALRSVSDLYKGYHASFGAARPSTRAALGAIVGGGTEATAESTNPDDPDYWLKVVGAAGAGAAAGLGVRASPAERAMIQRARLAGGSQGVQGRFTNPADVVRRLRGENIIVQTVNNSQGLKKLAQSRLGQAGDVLGMIWSRPLAEFGNVVESAPRYAAFQRAERQGLSQPEAAQAMRRVTVDFAAGGRFTKQLNQMVPFLNASTQAAVEGMDILKKNPYRAGALMATIVGGIVAAEIHNHNVAPDDYKDISRYTADTGIVWLDPNPPQGEGKRGLVYMPMRGWPGALVPITKAIMHAYFGDDPRTWQQLAKDTGWATLNQLSPVNADLGSLANSMVPPVASLIGQYNSNYDAFRDQPIVSRSMQGLPASEQYDDRTSQALRHLSRSNLPFVGGQSPMKMDWLARNFSPGPGEAVLGAADQLIHMTGQDLPNVTRNVPKGARDVPLVGGIAGSVLRTVGSERQNVAYQQADEIVQRMAPVMTAKLEESPDYQQATPTRQQQMLRSMQAEIQKQAELMTGVPDYAKPKDTGLPERFMGVPTGSALENEIAGALAESKTKRTPRQQVLVLTYGRSQNPYWTISSKQDQEETDRLRKQVQEQMAR